MKKLFVLLLLCLVPYFVVAQYWYKIDAMRIEESDGTKSEWKKCNYSAFIDENRNVKIFFPDETQIYRAYDDDYLHKISQEGDVRISWKALTGAGDRCVIYYMHDKYVSFIYLGIRFSDLNVWFNMIPND